MYTSHAPRDYILRIHTIMNLDTMDSMMSTLRSKDLICIISIHLETIVSRRIISMYLETINPEVCISISIVLICINTIHHKTIY